MLLSVLLAEPINPSKILLKSKKDGLNITERTNGILREGRYILSRTASSEPFRTEHQNKYILKPNNTSREVSKTTPLASLFSIANSENTAVLAIKGRLATFRSSLLHRDVVCLCSGAGDPEDLIASHVIPHSWMRMNYWGFPTTIREELTGMKDQVANEANGLLLYMPVDKLFDTGKLSVVPVDESNNVIAWANLRIEQGELVYDEGVKHDRFAFYALTEKASSYHLQPFIQIVRPQVKFGFPAFEYAKPSSLLLMHHFTLSVFRHMKGAGSTEDDDNDDDEDKFTSVLCEEALQERSIDTFGLDHKQYVMLLEDLHAASLF